MLARTQAQHLCSAVVPATASLSSLPPLSLVMMMTLLVIISQMFTVVNCSAVYYLYFEEPREPCSVIPLNLYSNAAVVAS